MAHDWSKEGDVYGNIWYRCRNCDKEQCRSIDNIGNGPFYRMRPLVGRCPATKDGRIAKRRNAILAAIKDGKHTPKGIAAHASFLIATVRTALSLAKRQGYVVNPRRGWWELAKDENTTEE